MMPQLTLGLQLRDAATFATFCAEGNETVTAYVQDFLVHGGTAGDIGLYLWGGRGCGKTHLLEASCHLANQKQLPALYVPLSHAETLSPDMFENTAGLACVMIDDLHCVAGQRVWEEALFHLYNQALASGTRLLFSAETSPQSLAVELPDLVSRLTQCTVFQLNALTEMGMAEALQLHAKARGFSLPEATIQYLLRRFERNMAALIDVLDKLDQASLVAKRTLTVPFVKSVLDQQ